MASASDAIRRLTIQTSAPGAIQATAELNALAAAQGGVAVTSATTERATLSLDKSFANIEHRYSAQLRAQQDYARLQAQVNQAVAQNPALQDRANAVLAAAADRYGQVTGAQKAFGIASQTVNLQIASLAGGLGVTGQILSAFGPWGFAAAVGLGALSDAFNKMVSEANRMGDKAVEMRLFSETTGLSISQLKALGRAGSELGVGTDSIAASVEKFTVSMEAARQGSGDLYNAVRQIDKGLADELASTKTTAQAWDVLAKARSAAADQSKNTLSKVAFGKGGFDAGLVLDVTVEAGGLDAIVARQQKLNGLSDDQIKKWGTTKIQIDEVQKRTANLMASTYTQDVLDRQLQAALLEERIVKAIITGNAERQKSVAGQYDAMGNFNSGAVEPPTVMDQARSNLAAGLNAGQKPDLSGYEAQRRAIEAVTTAQQNSIDTDKLRRDAAIRDANQTKELLGYLGSAATIDERATARTKELTAALQQNFLTQENYNRAISGVNLETETAKIGARTGSLSSPASVSDILALAKARLHAEQKDRDEREQRPLPIAA